MTARCENKGIEAKVLGKPRFDSPEEAKLFVEDDVRVLVDPTTASCKRCRGNAPSLEKAGPRRRIFFDPAAARIGIVHCGGLCPGMNDVTRAVVMVSWYRYGVRHITGFRYGYAGLTAAHAHPTLELTPELVADIHQHGGTILGTSRGPQDPAAMADYLAQRGINILFTVGGDGTQRGALAISRELEKRRLPVAVVGIPKTIDNDILFTDRTFGFETAVAASQTSIASAHMEAKGAENGVGLVKLMGRESGFVAVYASLASSDVNLVLIPEAPFSAARVMSFLEERLERKAHAVIVVAEGAGQDMAGAEGTDASGNARLGDIGLWLKSAIVKHFARVRTPVNVKYIDPSYTIRSAPAIADDSVFCFHLASNAVHAAMAGRTEVVVSMWNGQFVHVPIEAAVRERKKVDTAGLLWQSVLDNTGQPRDMSGRPARAPGRNAAGAKACRGR